MENNERIHPDVGTPEECREKMGQAYASFLDVASKFVSLAEFYSDKKNEGQPLGEKFLDSYNRNHKKLKEASPDDFCYQMAFYALVYLSYIEEVKENLEEYVRLSKGDDPSLSDYDQCCDYLTVKDEFKDLENVLKAINNDIAENREAPNHIGDTLYDPNAKEFVNS